MFKKTLVAALAVFSLGTALAAATSPASAGCEHETSSYGYGHNEDRIYGDGNRYSYRRSGYDSDNRYGHRRSYDSEYENGGY